MGFRGSIVIPAEIARSKAPGICAPTGSSSVKRASPFTEAENIAGFWATLGVLINFSLLVAAGIVFRRRAELHKRLMVFALMPLVFESLLHLSGTLVGRTPLPRGALIDWWLVTLLALHFVPAVHDKFTRGRIHPASIWVPLLSVGGFVVYNVVVAPSALAFKLGNWLLT